MPFYQDEAKNINVKYRDIEEAEKKTIRLESKQRSEEIRKKVFYQELMKLKSNQKESQNGVNLGLRASEEELRNISKAHTQIDKELILVDIKQDEIDDMKTKLKEIVRENDLLKQESIIIIIIIIF